MVAIPYGVVRSYGELALRAGYPRAARAVGTVCRTNKYPIIIPCHRVVGANGLGGYAYGSEMKKELLRLEKEIAADNKITIS
jgi:methylated-DNA-[protein]-cysteine S-methyltransferase